MIDFNIDTDKLGKELHDITQGLLPDGPKTVWEKISLSEQKVYSAIAKLLIISFLVNQTGPQIFDFSKPSNN